VSLVLERRVIDGTATLPGLVVDDDHLLGRGVMVVASNAVDLLDQVVVDEQSSRWPISTGTLSCS
jgi:hypothetical protein